MLKHLLLTTLAAGIAAGLGFADQSTGKVLIPVNRTAPTSGQQMFTSYCAPCHGVDGRGHGPAAAALATKPSDLTQLVKNNHGKFPDVHIVSVLQFGPNESIAAHGSQQMPIWGPILGRMNSNNPQEKQLRISNLSQYIRSIQEK